MHTVAVIALLKLSLPPIDSAYRVRCNDVVLSLVRKVKLYFVLNYKIYGGKRQ